VHRGACQARRRGQISRVGKNTGVSVTARTKHDEDADPSGGSQLRSEARLRVGSAERKLLRVLLVEDTDDDAELAIRELRRGGYEPIVTRVLVREDFKAALEADTWDVIISDHTLPAYGGLMALADLQATGKDIPFILVSGTIGEAVAVSAMRAGAHDYVLKGDLTRLPAAVEREVRERSVRAERAKIREQLIISDRMASAGTLAAGVAHEINNPLGVAMANLDFVFETLAGLAPGPHDESAGPADAPDPSWGGWNRLQGLDEPLRDIGEALRRIRDIVRDVKLFSRPQDEKTGAVDVRRVIESSVRMARNEIRHRARLVEDYRPVPLVNANESRLGQVVLNLVVNAVQAMPDGRGDGNVLRVATRTRDDGKVVIEVSDTGSGIPRAHLERIFDPFFTTKAVGVGTGLGLAICHRIVAELDGTIEVDSEVGKGTTFSVVLPFAQDGAATRPASNRPMVRQRARVLIVDDEPAMARAIERGLSVHHEISTLTSGKEALARIQAGDHFDVIVSDLMMPEMTGMELYEQIHRSSPEVAERMIFMTGGAFTPMAREFLQRIPNPRIDKPIETANLLAIVAGIVSRPRS
jgi:signal transduction histidine kinase